MKRWAALCRAMLAALALVALAGCSRNEPGNPGAPAASAVAPAASIAAALPALPVSHPVIDVWKLRSEVARIEPMAAEDNTEGCHGERDPDEQETPQEMAAREKSERACEEKIHAAYAGYRRAHEEFNKTWLPVMMDAIKQGDLVAEVIMRQCSTTPLFDRSGIESSCDQDPQRRIVAAKRLREIGFAPAFDLEGEAMARRMQDKPAQNNRLQYVAPSRREAQQLLLERFRLGVFGVSDTEMMNAWHTGNAPNSADEAEDIRRAAVVDAVMQDVQRAFTYSSGRFSAGWRTDAFYALRLNRAPLTPGYLTWGRKLYYGGEHSYWTGEHYWRSGPLKIYLQYASNIEALIAYQGDAAFMGMLRDTLAASEASIDRSLAQDKRWSVFLLHRVGLHEWVPEGMESSTGKLEKEWQGEWVLEKEFVDWQPASVPAGFGATIYAENGATRIRFRNGDDGPKEEPCELRYSGGKTYIPGSAGLGSSSTDTPLGYLPAISGISQFDPSPKEPFAPLDPKVQYPQVLVQCPQGEWPDSERVRFLLRANDTLIEVTWEPGGTRLVMLHYRRQTAK